MPGSITRASAVLMLLALASVAHAQTTPAPEAAKARAGHGASGTTSSGQDSATGAPGTDFSGPSVQGTIEVHSAPQPAEGPAPVDARVKSNVVVVPATAGIKKSQELKCLCTDPSTNETKCDFSCCAEQDHSVCTEP